MFWPRKKPLLPCTTRSAAFCAETVYVMHVVHTWRLGFYLLILSLSRSNVCHISSNSLCCREEISLGGEVIDSAPAYYMLFKKFQSAPAVSWERLRWDLLAAWEGSSLSCQEWELIFRADRNYKIKIISKSVASSSSFAASGAQNSSVFHHTHTPLSR